MTSQACPTVPASLLVGLKWEKKGLALWKVVFWGGGPTTVKLAIWKGEVGKNRSFCEKGVVVRAQSCAHCCWEAAGWHLVLQVLLSSWCVSMTRLWPGSAHVNVPKWPVGLMWFQRLSAWLLWLHKNIKDNNVFWCMSPEMWEEWLISTSEFSCAGWDGATGSCLPASLMCALCLPKGQRYEMEPWLAHLHSSVHRTQELPYPCCCKRQWLWGDCRCCCAAVDAHALTDGRRQGQESLEAARSTCGHESTLSFPENCLHFVLAALGWKPVYCGHSCRAERGFSCRGAQAFSRMCWNAKPRKLTVLFSDFFLAQQKSCILDPRKVERRNVWLFSPMSPKT